MIKNCSRDQEFFFEIEAEGQELAKNFEITGTVYLNSERSNQFLKNNWDLETCRKS